MGLGKTVISLALILKNPAPALPVSGSPLSSLGGANTSDGGAFWDPDMTIELKKGTKKKRGRIISRGTLVVVSSKYAKYLCLPISLALQSSNIYSFLLFHFLQCTVSLVGQWIDEAKSKLSNPGLVYPYHGGSRKRDPSVLAQNSIVVTTYETLQSDVNYHSKKSSDPDYCPPCEQVRWWRIICDESHILRNASGKSNAVMDLVGENKWLVTGTPLCTQITDLKNQLRFLGIEEAAAHMKNPSGRRRHAPTYKGIDLLKTTFQLRPLMMRHSHAQTYRGTATTLMSLPPKVRFVLKTT